MRRPSNDFLIFLGLVLAPIAGVYFAGVTLFVENQTTERIEDIAIDYGTARAELAELAPQDDWSERVGKIGEGVRLTLSFRQRGQRFRSTVGIYLPDCDGFVRTSITFEILDAGRVRARCDGDQVLDERAITVR